MYSMLKNWKGSVEINGVKYENIQDAENECKTLDSNICILLHSKVQSVKESEPARQAVTLAVSDDVYKIEVKPFMTRKSSPTFDFMEKFNDNNPMPLKVMVGKVLRETPGMVYMQLHGDIVQEQTDFCMKCGKPITNAVSKYFGMGPECGKHNYINPFDTDAQLERAVSLYRTKLQEITWEGWVIKSAIINKEVITNE